MADEENEEMCDICVAIFDDNPGFFKHWALAVISETDDESFYVHVMGGSTRYHLDVRHKNARESATCVELICIGQIPESEKEFIEKAAKKKVKIRNDDEHWDCQDWVVDFMKYLDRKGVISASEEDWDMILSKQEGREAL